MPSRFQMGDLRTRCKRRADKEGDPQISDGEWNSLISEQYGELWGIVAETGMRYFETLLTIVTDGSTSYAEPANHYETVGMCQVVDTARGTRRDLVEIMAQERSRYSGLTGDALGYALIDDRIFLCPVPPAGQTYELLYVPQPVELTTYTDAQIVDVVTPDGLSFILWGVTVKAHAKSESDAQLAIAEREAARVRLTEDCVLRALNSPRRRIVRSPGLFGEFDDDLARDEGGWWNR